MNLARPRTLHARSIVPTATASCASRQIVYWRPGRGVRQPRKPPWRPAWIDWKGQIEISFGEDRPEGAPDFDGFTYYKSKRALYVNDFDDFITNVELIRRSVEDQLRNRVLGLQSVAAHYGHYRSTKRINEALIYHRKRMAPLNQHFAFLRHLHNALLAAPAKYRFHPFISPLADSTDSLRILNRSLHDIVEVQARIDEGKTALWPFLMTYRVYDAFQPITSGWTEIIHSIRALLNQVPNNEWKDLHRRMAGFTRRSTDWFESLRLFRLDALAMSLHARPPNAIAAIHATFYQSIVDINAHAIDVHRLLARWCQKNAGIGHMEESPLVRLHSANEHFANGNKALYQFLINAWLPSVAKYLGSLNTLDIAATWIVARRYWARRLRARTEADWAIRAAQEVVERAKLRKAVLYRERDRTGQLWKSGQRWRKLDLGASRRDGGGEDLANAA